MTNVQTRSQSLSNRLVNISNAYLGAVYNALSSRVLRIPEKRFAEASKSRKELSHTGVYLLVERAEVAGERSRVYVGEAEDLRTRLKQHADKRDDWTEALVFTRKSNELNKAHVKYLESVLYDALCSADRYEVTNGNTPTRSSLHETDQYAMEDFAERVKLLTGVLGHPMFVDLAPTFLQPTAPEETELIFELGVPHTNLIARMRRTDEGYVVLKGSHARNSLVDSMKTASRNARRCRTRSWRRAISAGR